MKLINLLEHQSPRGTVGDAGGGGSRGQHAGFVVLVADDRLFRDLLDECRGVRLDVKSLGTRRVIRVLERPIHHPHIHQQPFRARTAVGHLPADLPSPIDDRDTRWRARFCRSAQAPRTHDAGEAEGRPNPRNAECHWAVLDVATASA